MDDIPLVDIRPLEIPDVKLITPKKFADHRGFFSEVYNHAQMLEAGIDVAFVQDNQSLSRQTGVLRGLHYQVGPTTQDKLVRVLKGRILDVAVDIRRGSPTFGKHVSAELSSENWVQIFVPKGFAHGFVTLEPDTEVMYKVSDFYSPADERGIRFDDPALGIDWRVEADKAVLSDRDRKHPTLAEQPDLL